MVQKLGQVLQSSTTKSDKFTLPEDYPAELKLVIQSTPTWSEFTAKYEKLKLNFSKTITAADIESLKQLITARYREVWARNQEMLFMRWFADRETGKNQIDIKEVLPGGWPEDKMPVDMPQAVEMINKFLPKVIMPDHLMDIKMAKWKSTVEEERTIDYRHSLYRTAYTYYCMQDNRAYLVKPDTAEEWQQEMLLKIKRLIPGFEVHKEGHPDGKNNVEALLALCYYFMGDSRFTDKSLFPRHTAKGYNDNWDLNKGLWFVGSYGTGKTTIMRALSINPKLQYLVKAAVTITDEFDVEGREAVTKYNGLLKNNSYSAHYGHDKVGLCIDDAGGEGTGRNYGKKAEIINDIIYRRYDARLPYPATHITSNDMPEELKGKYDERVLSRMKQMFNVVVIFGPGNRK